MCYVNLQKMIQFCLEFEEFVVKVEEFQVKVKVFEQENFQKEQEIIFFMYKNSVLEFEVEKYEIQVKDFKSVVSEGVQYGIQNEMLIWRF